MLSNEKQCPYELSLIYLPHCVELHFSLKLSTMNVDKLVGKYVRVVPESIFAGKF